MSKNKRGQAARATALTTAVAAVAAAVAGDGCRQRPPVLDESQRINSGVNIVPSPVLAAERVEPSRVSATQGLPDLVDTVNKADHAHFYFLQVLRNADLVPTLQSAGPYTVLAPTDAAFDKLPPGTLDRLLEPKHHAELVAFAKYHLLTGRVTFADMLHTNGQVDTVAGRKVIIKGVDGKVTVNDANLTQTDTTPSNGIVHWIDGVLIPPVAN